MRKAPKTSRTRRIFLFTPLFLATILAANLSLGVLDGGLSGANLEKFGVSLASLQNGEWLRLLTGSFISRDAGMLLRQLFLAAISIGWFEWRYGPLRAGAMFFLLDILGTLLLMFGVIYLIQHLNLDGVAELPTTFDVGMSAGGFGLIGASLFHLRWRGRAMAIGLAVLVVKLLTFPEPIADIAHLIMLPFGFLVEALVSRLIAPKPDRAR